MDLRPEFLKGCNLTVLASSSPKYISLSFDLSYKKSVSPPYCSDLRLKLQLILKYFLITLTPLTEFQFSLRFVKYSIVAVSSFNVF